MTLVDFWTTTDAAQQAASQVVRVDPRIESIYRHALVFESWRHHLLANRLGAGAPFWYEAQNDFLLALIHAGRGIWRSSLQALRSCVENATGALYYSEHPVEGRRFANGDFRLSWTETKQYFASYPYGGAVGFRASIWVQLSKEYAELSKAVHGSAESFRMTAAQRFPALCSNEVAKIGTWQTRAGNSAKGVHFLFLAHFASDLSGARLRGLREDLGGVLSARDRTRVRQALNVVIPAP